MEEKMKRLARRLEEIEAQLLDGAIYGDLEKYRALSREQRELAPLVETWRRLQARRADLAAALELAADPDFKDSAQEEISGGRRDIARLVFSSCSW